MQHNLYTMRMTVLILMSFLINFTSYAQNDTKPSKVQKKLRLSTTKNYEIGALNKREKVLVIPNYMEPIPGDTMAIITRYIGDLFVNNGVSSQQSGAVKNGGNVKMVINTKDLAARGLYTPIRGGGPHMWIAKRLSDKNILTPWAKNQKLVLQMRAAVPYVHLQDKEGNTSSSNFSADQAPVTQLSFGIYLYDQESKKTFAYIIPVYESRGTYQESANNNDTYTSFISSPLEDKSKYITKSTKSESLQSQPFNKKKFFEVSLTKENLLKGIKDSNINLSEDLSKYQITFLGVLFELPNYVEGGNNISMVEVSDFSAFISE